MGDAHDEEDGAGTEQDSRHGLFNTIAHGESIGRERDETSKLRNMPKEQQVRVRVSM